ncbi:MAG: alanine--tRNA ligase, partial [Chloroflexota bacterium]
PELRTAAGTIAEVTQGEEERFISTLDQGLPILNELIAKTRAVNQNILPGEDVFKLYDTYGFPLDLIAEAAREQGMTLDETGFRRAIEEQRERTRKMTRFGIAAAKPAIIELTGRVGSTRFVGYEQLEAEGTVQAILRGERFVKEAVEGEDVELVLDVTPFYAEGGGQVGDQGVLMGPEGRVEIRETTRPVPDLVLHKGTVKVG